MPVPAMPASFEKLLQPGRISVQSLEAFISQNLEELSGFTRSQRLTGFRDLLQTYNTRVDAVENDKSLLIEITSFLTVSYHLVLE